MTNSIRRLGQLSVIILFTCLTPFVDAAQLPDPVDFHRTEWGARKPKSDISTYQSYGVAKPQYRSIVLHSTHMGYGVGPAEAQRIQNYEMDHMGFADIGYNFLIDSEGNIFEGRLLTYVPSHAGQSVEANDRDLTNKDVGDITKDPDFGSIGIAFSSGPDSPVSEKQLRAANKIIEFFVRHERFQVNQVITHAEVAPLLRSKRLTPVGDYDPHVCPGDHNLEALVRLRRNLLEKLDIPFDETEFRDLFHRYVKPQTKTRSRTNFVNSPPAGGLR